MVECSVIRSFVVKMNRQLQAPVALPAGRELSVLSGRKGNFGNSGEEKKLLYVPGPHSAASGTFGCPSVSYFRQ